MKNLSLTASVLLASLPLAALISGCGGGGGGLIGSTPTPNPTATTTATTTATAVGTSTPTGAPTATRTPNATPTATRTPNTTPTATRTPNATPTPTRTAGPQPTPTRTSTPAPTLTPIGGTQVTAPFTLSSGQSATLKVTISGNTINGTLVVPQDPNGAFKAIRQAVIAVPKGTYTISGTFTAPRSYSVTGTISDGTFTLSGLLPTTTQTGTYSFTYFGRTDSGTIPKLS